MNGEQVLINRIRGGDHEAFSILVKPLLSSAYKSAYIILRSKEHAEDALQTALEGAYVSIMKKKDITNFKGWFYRLVYSRSIDIYRKNNRHASIDYEESHEAQLKITSESAQQIAIHKESKSEMVRHLMRLKRDQCLPLFLYYYEDMSVKEISLILNENINTVKARMKRGKQSLGKILQESRQFLQEVKVNGI
ncbi:MULTISPECIES: RNA polymerase sigma factor [Mesobacillus]|uniref:RNA polymerase sigma factor n=1 Tax=Mesobacillus selenatarsenatis TaxID=388741 RepID=A0A846TF01_9BACI|nr:MULTISPECIES: RNA polymerase sigma factor [Mesobacillus]NKE03912.1 RNA polymerase sigma factor [Mesobacillus selenatarsenatis]